MKKINKFALTIFTWLNIFFTSCTLNFKVDDNLQKQYGADYYYFIREISAPSVIVECAFIDHAQDIKILDTAAEQKSMGVAIAKGILKTLGIAYKGEAAKEETPAQPAQKPESGKLYRCQCGAFRDKSNAENMVKKLKAAGFDAFIVEV